VERKVPVNASPLTVLGLGVLLCYLLMAFCAAVTTAADVYSFRDNGGAVYYTNVPGEGRHKVRLPMRDREGSAKKELTYRNAPSFPERSSFADAIASASENYAVDPYLISAVIKAESNFNPRAVSLKGAAGLMQLMPGTARDMGVADSFDPEENINGGTRYLSLLLDAFDDNLPLALAAYNAGPARVAEQMRIPPIPETRTYIERVLQYYKSLRSEMSYGRARD
jgi:soluble lytic murein transglycosylase-like protein